jgi:hypothetical protein
MKGFFSEHDVAELNNAKEGLRQKFGALRNRLIVRSYKSDRGREYAFHGLVRRLDTMLRAIDYVFEALPPEKEDIPKTDETVAVTILIQSFVVNAYGCLDNLAWIWVFETNQKGKWGQPLDRRMVGLGESYWALRKSFSKPFRKYLKERKKWFRHVSEFRDSLAHRIPLYVPTFVLSEENILEYKRLEQAAFKAVDYKTYNELKSQQEELGVYRPWMTHSPTEGSPAAVFHQQMIQDFLTIDECANKLLEEIDLFEKHRTEKNSLSEFLKSSASRCQMFVARLFTGSH